LKSRNATLIRDCCRIHLLVSYKKGIGALVFNAFVDAAFPPLSIEGAVLYFETGAYSPGNGEILGFFQQTGFYYFPGRSNLEVLKL
jgi:hypothetical protein